MTPETLALARRAVACPRWRWLPGMLAAHVAGADQMGFDADRVRVEDEWEQGGPIGAPLGWLTDLTDPATLGCMMALVREAAAIEDAAIMHYVAEHMPPFRLGIDGMPEPVSPPPRPVHTLLVRALTYLAHVDAPDALELAAGALVAALECAP